MKRSRWILVALVLVMLLVLLNWAFPREATPITDDEPRLALVSAFSAEMTRLLDEAEVERRIVINGRTHHIGKLHGHDVVLVQSGVSMVNAAMATQALVDHFNLQGIVISGIAGGVNPDLNIGDVTVAAQWGQYQEHIFARQKGGQYDTGAFQAPFGHYGMMFPRGVKVTQQGGVPDLEERHFWFKADKQFLRDAQALEHLPLGTCAPNGACLEHTPRVVIGGNGVSGPTFLDNADYRAWVGDTFAAQAVDMETAAIAHVAYVHSIPFIAFRSLSDLAGGEAESNHIQTFFQLAADNSAKVVLTFLKSWEP